MNDTALTSLCQRIGHDLKQLRKHRGFSQAEAAQRVGIHRATLSKIEAGDMGVALGTVVALSRLYEAPPSFLMVMGVTIVPSPRRRPDVGSPAMMM